jgi:hypothetical protein
MAVDSTSKGSWFHPGTPHHLVRHLCFSQHPMGVVRRELNLSSDSCVFSEGGGCLPLDKTAGVIRWRSPPTNPLDNIDRAGVFNNGRGRAP